MVERQWEMRQLWPFFRHVLSRFKAGNSRDEQLAVLHCSRAEGPEETLYLCSRLLLPDKRDLDSQGPSGVIASRQFQSVAYGLALDLDLSVFDVHTHPFQETVRLPKHSIAKQRCSESGPRRHEDSARRWWKKWHILKRLLDQDRRTGCGVLWQTSAVGLATLA